jgi:D-3-phosphoglycerate dehydrogenase / 2-oxoglutarate reductase
MKILVLSSIDSCAVEQLASEHDVISAVGAEEPVLRSLIRDREVLVFRSGVIISADLMRCAPDLKLLVRAGSGFDNIDLEYIAKHGLEFVRVPEPGARAVAELTFGLMLSVARKVVWADGMWRQGHWVKTQSSGYLLRGKVLGVVGAGSIGAQVGELGAAWGMEAIGCVARPSAAIAARLQEWGIRLSTFGEVVERADFLSLHVPLTDSTRQLIGADVFARMKPGSFLINMARGGVVDEAALRRELVDGRRLLGAALDVHEREGEGNISILADLPNVVLTPHIGSQAIDTQREIGVRVVSIIESFQALSPAAAQDAVVA